MTERLARPLTVALLFHSYGRPRESAVTRQVQELAVGLQDAGHRVRVLASPGGSTRRDIDEAVEVTTVRRIPEVRLGQRGFAGPITHVPSMLSELMGGGYDVAHAFSAPDAFGGQLWRRRSGGPIVFTPGEPIVRERLSDRRLRLWLTERAVERSDAVVAGSEEQRRALWRWLAVDAPAVSPGDAGAYARLYEQLRTGPPSLRP